MDLKNRGNAADVNSQAPWRAAWIRHADGCDINPEFALNDKPYLFFISGYNVSKSVLPQEKVRFLMQRNRNHEL